MLRRIVAAVVVVSILGYGTGWAFAGHAVDPADHAAGGTPAEAQFAFGGGGCDHCCHALAHMVGLAPPLPALYQPSADRFRPAAGATLAAIASAPPLKPPRV